VKEAVKATIQTIAILAGVALALVARFAEKPAFLWPAIGCLVVGVSIRFIRMGR
jgi:hypothetical protein